MMQQPNQTMMTQPTMEKSYADIPVQPQTKVEQPAAENIWDQEQPKNPFWLLTVRCAELDSEIETTTIDYYIWNLVVPRLLSEFVGQD